LPEIDYQEFLLELPLVDLKKFKKLKLDLFALKNPVFYFTISLFQVPVQQ